MKIKDQVCSLKQAKKLVGQGVVLDTTWYWWIDNDSGETGITDHEFQLKARNWYYKNQKQYTLYPAPNVAELEVLLHKAGWRVCRDNNFWVLENIYAENDNDRKYFHLMPISIQEGAQAKAEALIWLIDNGFVKVEDLKL